VLRLTDTQTKTVREVVPSTPGLLRVYACGPTVYRHAHVGQPALVPARRPDPPAAELRGLRVQLVQNITDVGHLADDSAVDSTARTSCSRRRASRTRARSSSPASTRTPSTATWRC
jgi:cysteinyl-tRNA synthetase